MNMIETSLALTNKQIIFIRIQGVAPITYKIRTNIKGSYSLQK
jgi:hypothetical protein